MARQVITTLIDDLDGGKAEETVTFAFDGTAYEIDLSGKNALKFRKALEPYITAGTKVGRGGIVRSATPPRSSSAASREENAAIRAWAKAQGKDISDRGRISQEIVDEYRSNGRKR
jgi:hypothetical protein